MADEQTTDGGMNTEDKELVTEVTNVFTHPSPGTLLPLEDEFRELEAEAPVVVRETKAGYKTTEFYLTITTAFLTAVGALPTPHDAKTYVVAGLVGLYAVARAIAKKGVANVDPS